MREIVVFNDAVARVTLKGAVERVGSHEYAARGRVCLQVSAKKMSKERFLRKFFECVFPGDMSYEEALEEFGPGVANENDDMLPDLGKPAIRVYSRTLCEWKDPSFTVSHYDDVWADAGAHCGEDSDEAARMRLGSGTSNFEVTLEMTQIAETIEALFLADRLQWPPSIDLIIGVFLDYQAAQGEGSWFKTMDARIRLSPAPLPMQAILLDGTPRRYRLIAEPASGPARFIRRPSASLQLMPDPAPVPPGCTSTLVQWGDAGYADLLVMGGTGEMAMGHDAMAWAQNTYYQIDVPNAPAGGKPFELTHESTAAFDAIAMKWHEDGKMVEAPEAVIAVEPAGEGDLWNAEIKGEGHRRHVVVSIDQARGSRAARNASKAVLSSPDDFVLRRVDTLHVTLTVGSWVLKRTLLVGSTLQRWFPLEGSDAETHLRTNHATLLQGLRDAITRYNAEHGPPARFNVVAQDGFDKLAAGNFLFRHNASDTFANRFFFTRPDEVKRNEELATEWLHTLWGVPPPVDRPPALTEAALLVRIIELREKKSDKLTPGDVFGLGLEETGGDIGGAFLLAHNTMRSLARDCGDGFRTGIFALDKDRFDKLFVTIRGGYRCTDGSAGAPKDEKCAEANFAGDNAGPWYHYFGTAYYETYTATPDEKAPEGNYWARTANVLEQWYREYCPTSWQDPDPEKEYVNRCGIAAADELLKEHPWMRE